MEKIIIIVIALCLCFVGKSVAQSNQKTISGTVLDSNGNALPFSNISEKNTSNGTTSNEQGEFMLKTNSPNKAVLLISYLGYTTKEVTIEDFSNARNLVFQLKPKEHHLNEVLVGGKSVATKIEQQGFVATSIPIKELQSQSVELNQVLNQSAGIVVREQGGLGSRVNYSINGLEGSAVRFFLDGIPLDYFGSSYSVSTIPVSQINRIDIFKGVVPVELGSDALGGAINLVTKKNLKNTLEIDYTYGSFNTHKVSASGYGRANNGLTAKVSAFYNYSDNNYKVWGSDISVTNPETFEVMRGITAERFHDAYQSKAIKTDFGVTNKTWADHFFVGLLTSSMDKEIQHGATMIVPFGEATYSQNLLMPYLDYSNRQLLKQKLKVKLFTSYSGLNRARVDTSKNIYNWLGEIEPVQRVLGGEQKRTLNKLKEEVWMNRVNLNYTFSSMHKLVVNHVYTDLTRTDSDPLVTQKTEGYYAPQFFNKSVLGVSWENLWFQHKLQTTLFYKRYNYSAAIKLAETVAGETNYETVSAKEKSNGLGFAISYTPAKKITLSFSVEQASRLPEANEILGDGLNVLANPNLKAESSLNTNLGIDVSLSEQRNSRVRINGNVFFRDVKQKMKLVTASDPALLQVVNFDKVQMSGIDGRIQYYYKEFLSIFQSLAFLHPVIKTDSDEFGNNNGLDNTRMPNTPFFQANSEARLNFGNLLQNKPAVFVYWRYGHVGSFYRHSEKYGSENKDHIPAQNIHSVGTGYTFPKTNLTASGAINNLFNAQAFDNYAVQKPGRAFYLKLTYKIF
ncbi:Outer membrane receptor proteins, mostly Fe transport [Mariniphaga anaerophila]|uniref:Outer membrane receptor proteins, mostly Fe transport n=1 Tax=Mariniphaga anaerophila TaxID=1484053 RepID=A0A1M4VSB7_9BACT|nr:TonB-dependent receptor [Mariniphaga anaerophila]SHE72021.1 Outer membrane receptor proteins, mostly Fe transport [Mariniphaga anaerophila]